jgi:hypothetical protein
MLRFRIPELFLGCFLTVAVFAAGVLFSAQYSHQSAQSPAAEKPQQATSGKSEPKGFWEGVTTDPVAAFTLCLVFVGGLQAYLFLRQLKIINESIGPAKEAAEAAKVAARAATDALRDYERPWVFVELDPRLHQDGPDAYALFSIVNHGRFPATVTECSIFLGYGDPEPQDGFSVTEFLGFIGPGKALADKKHYAPGNLVYGAAVDLQTRNSYAAPDSQRGEFFFKITVRYEWVNGARDTFSYCWVYYHGDDCWTKYSGGEIELSA